MIYLVRHGESEANINKRFSGITDVKLSTKGREQAREAGKNLLLEKISHIYTSPLMRARDTAKIIAEEIKYHDNIVTDNRLIEVNFGLFENLTWDEITSLYKEESESWISTKHLYKFPEGEGYDDIVRRVSTFVDIVPDNSLVVSHFGVIQSMLLYLGIVDNNNLWDIKISNCDILAINNNKLVNIIKCNK